MSIAELKTWIHTTLETIDPRAGEPSPEYANIVRELKIKTLEAGLPALSLSLPIEDRKYAVSAAGQLRRVLEELKVPAPAADIPTDGLLNLEQAAAYLGYNAAGLRKLCHQQRIQFLQNGRGPIRFRREWLDEFITANASGPDDIERSPAQRRTQTPPVSVDPQFGFDPSLFYADSQSGCE